MAKKEEFVCQAENQLLRAARRAARRAACAVHVMHL